ncbi:MAG: phosphonopyruvate decarboxylase [Clostridia bacterium]|nr:phosphonopyruvate decarboxylase [Clostridia bacterium]
MLGEFYTGVPDSQLKAFCNCLIDTYGISKEHIIAANEGNCTALAAGYHLATGKIPVVYMQNSGIGNIINPVASLLNEKVYGIPCVFIVGWRGEPGIHDEPQHVFQGEITIKLLEDIGIKTFVIDKTTAEAQMEDYVSQSKAITERGNSVAFVVKKGALSFDKNVKYSNENIMKREDIIRHIVDHTGEDIIVSTTGKASRELFEIREANGQSHKYDFLTVGSMGHSSSIALGIALQKPNTRVWVIDGDGSVLMHMGAMAVIGANSPKNMIHIVINNGAHETVGGMPTVSEKINLPKIAEGCGYPEIHSVDSFSELDRLLEKVKEFDRLTFVEIKCSIGARDDLGRPTTTAKENKINFMNYLKEL